MVGVTASRPDVADSACRLFGFHPEADHEWITHDTFGRRITPEQAERSLLLLKPTMSVAHEGGQRLHPDESEYHTLVRWISAGAPQSIAPGKPEVDLVRLRLYPSVRSLHLGETQQLVAMAEYSDGSRRDVTRLVRFRTNDETIAVVNEWGFVTAGERIGETSIVASLSGDVAVSSIRRPVDREWSADDEFVVRNVIDERIQEQLRSLRVPPSTVCDDATFLRRATQQIAGRLPTLEETQQLLE